MKHCIVLIDDDADTILCLKIALEIHHYDVMGASTGFEGLELVRRHHPSLVLVDVTMPDLSGHEICRRLRVDPATAGIPIIVLSARSTPADQAAAFDAGADKYVAKPVSLKELVKLVDALVAQPERAYAGTGEGI